MQVMETTYKALFTADQMKAAGATAQIAVVPLRRGLTLLSGAGGNILALFGPDGAVAVDSGLSTAQAQISKALAAVTVEPLRYLINTHCHFDHAGGNEWMHSAGAEIIAQERARLRMDSEQIIPAFDAVVPPSPSSALPTVLFAQSQTLAVNDEVIQLRRHTPAHTDTDISAFFAKANVLHTGDTWFHGIYPFIDYDNGGSIRGMLAASAENLSLANSETIVIPGHGEAGGRNDLLDFHEMLLSVCDKVAALKKSGDSVEAVVAARPTLPFDDAWGSGFIPPDLFVSLVYRGL
jgi:glyoxylase-like metal-dependent hydrolase (beta-lactamase superfamily II)